MNKKILIIIIVAVLIVALSVGGYFYWSKKTSEERALEATGDAAEKLTESMIKSILPSMQTNPLENKPDINPIDQTNPFKNIKTNPFE